MSKPIKFVNKIYVKPGQPSEILGTFTHGKYHFALLRSGVEWCVLLQVGLGFSGEPKPRRKYAVFNTEAKARAYYNKRVRPHAIKAAEQALS